MSVRSAQFGITWDVPTEGRVGALLTMRLRVTNHTSELRALKLTFSENDSFLFCGLKLYHFRLPPGFSHCLSFNLVPIKTDATHLPTPKLFDVRGRTSGSHARCPHALHMLSLRSSHHNRLWVHRVGAIYR